MQAVLNPLQAFLNAFVYWGPGGCTSNVPGQVDSSGTYNYLSNNHPDRPGTDSEENTPLIRQSLRMGSGRR